MKELTMNEINAVSGGHDGCDAVPASPPSGTFEGWYESAINFTSYVIERVANTFK